jgi:hypothetical protein
VAEEQNEKAHNHEGSHPAHRLRLSVFAVLGCYHEQYSYTRYVSRQVCKSVQVCQTPVSVGRIVESSNYPTARSGNRSGLGSHCVTAASDSALR